MRNVNSIRLDAVTTRRAGGLSDTSGDLPARRRSPRHTADAVTASYIHDISQASRRSPRPRGSRQLIVQPV